MELVNLLERLQYSELQDDQPHREHLILVRVVFDGRLLGRDLGEELRRNVQLGSLGDEDVLSV